MEKIKQNIRNRVVDESYQSSQDFYKSDLILKDYLMRKLSTKGMEYMQDKLHFIGKKAAMEMDSLSLDADKNGPE